MTTKPTVFIVDDDEAVRESLCEMVRAMPLPAKCFAAAEAFLDDFDPSWHGCLVLDVRMPGMTGLELQEKLAEQGIGLPVIIITGHGDIPMVVQSMRQGAFDFLEKPYRPDQLRASIRRALEIDAQRRQEQAKVEDVVARLALLTSSETDVLEGIVAGRTNKQIAVGLDVSLRTVQFRRSNVMKKLNVDSRTDLVRLVLSVKKPS